MANFHLEFEPISRKQGRSPIRAASYQSGEKLRDDYYGKTYYHNRNDVLYTEIMLPIDAPPELSNRQILWHEVDKIENRSDSRTAHRVIGSLPNEKEFMLDDYIKIIREYVSDNFVEIGMCTDVAIHMVKNINPTRNNPHVHILLTDRPVNQNGFCSKKNRDWNKRENIKLWREEWANVQNRAYERKGLNVRITAKSYIDRGIFDREPKQYLIRKDMYLERINIRTIKGDKNRAIEKRNREHEISRDRDR